MPPMRWLCESVVRCCVPFSESMCCCVAHIVTAVTGFWRRLHEFAGLGLPRKGWQDVCAGHPLRAVQNGRIRVRQPEN